MKIELVSADDSKLLRKVKSLYRKAFPRFERKPFAVILKNREKGIARINAIMDESGNFCGLVILAEYKDLELLDYFAVCPKMRGSGIGAAVLEKLIEASGEKRFFLEIERPDGKNSMKSRRKAFYLRNGMTETGVHVRVFGVNMELLSSGCDVSFEEYAGFYQYMIGDRALGNIIEVK